MAIVSAYTFPDADRELPPKKVTGTLTVYHVAALNYDQHLVNGTIVDPKTIERKQAPDLYAKSYSCLAKALGKAGVIDLWLRAHSQEETTLLRVMRLFFQDMAETLEPKIRAALRTSPHGHIHVRQLFDAPFWADRLRSVLREPLRLIIATGAARELELFKPRKGQELLRVKRKIEPGGSWDARKIKLPPEVEAAIDKHAAKLLKKPYWNDMTASIKADIVKALDKGIKEGLAGDQLADKVMDKMGPDATEGRAKNASRTESTGALNAGHQATRDMLQKAGLVKAKTWNCLDDEHTRDTHVEADGQEVPNDQPFVVGSETAMYPGDPDLSAEERCGCRCAALSVTTGDELIGGDEER
jgi:hypothetical protein